MSQDRDSLNVALIVTSQGCGHCKVLRPDEGWLLSPEKSRPGIIPRASAWNHAFMKKLLTGLDNPTQSSPQIMRVYNIDLPQLHPSPVSTALDLHVFDWVEGVVRQTIYQPYYTTRENKKVITGTTIRTPSETKTLSNEPFNKFIETIIPASCFNYFYFFPMYAFADATLWNRSLEDPNVPLFMRVNGAPVNEKSPYGIIKDPKLVDEAQAKILDVASIPALIKSKSPLFSLIPKKTESTPIDTGGKISISEVPLQTPVQKVFVSTDTSKPTGNLIPLRV